MGIIHVLKGRGSFKIRSSLVLPYLFSPRLFLLFLCANKPIVQPTRHAYGALLLEQGHVEEAIYMYSADLGVDHTLPRALQHPNNVWALHGYHECLMKLGRTAEACIIEPQLKVALAVADVPINSSCCCRLGKEI
jgi:hypothetical protein